MKKITISVVFNQWGHGNVNVIPTNYNQWNPTTSSSNDYNLDAGQYSVTYLTATGNGGLITVTEAGNPTPLASFPLATGVDGGNFDITV